MQDPQQNREERRAKIRKKKRQRLIAIAAMVLVVVLVIVLVSTIVGAIKRKNRVVMTQIGPPIPTEADMVSDIPAYYDYTQPVPVSSPVSSFSGALFVGDARLAGFGLYGIMPEAEILSSSSANVETVLTASFDNTTLDARLSTGNYDAVYIVLGINELGWQYADSFSGYYASLIDTVQAKQPRAAIYLQLIVPVSAAKNGSPSWLNNTKIESYNAMIRQLAQEKGVYYLDASPALCDENGFLQPSFTSDGLNFNRAGIETWYEYLRTHYVAKEKYVN